MINPAKQSLASAAKNAGLKDVSASVLEQDMTSLQKLHGIFVFDVRSGVDSPSHFTRNLNSVGQSGGNVLAPPRPPPSSRSRARGSGRLLAMTYIADARPI